MLRQKPVFEYVASPLVLRDPLLNLPLVEYVP